MTPLLLFSGRSRPGAGRRAVGESLGAKAFRLCEKDLGYAHVSDALEDMPDEEVVGYLRGCLKYAKRAVKSLERIISDHEHKPPARAGEKREAGGERRHG
jgi:hypothetical protein